MTTHDVSQKFLRFAEKEFRDSSPLYESLAIRISKDDDRYEEALTERGRTDWTDERRVLSL